MVELHITYFYVTALVLPWSQSFSWNFFAKVRERAAKWQVSGLYAEDNLVPRDPRVLSKGRTENLVTRLMQMVQDPTLRRWLVDIFADMQNNFALLLWEQGMSCHVTFLGWHKPIFHCVLSFDSTVADPF
mgnify:CR=1 FL=1